MGRIVGEIATWSRQHLYDVLAPIFGGIVIRLAIAVIIKSPKWHRYQCFRAIFSLRIAIAKERSSLRDLTTESILIQRSRSQSLTIFLAHRSFVSKSLDRDIFSINSLSGLM
ncbi:hypothetical protein [Acaryochloris marina]|uniref:hypothetical protein n=1 Tax=Acaryochloris marina TaxID=155978 RepID=UPI001BAF923B|nr:hypothetical protein [Acaryochloris marina]QUY44277.1 hypothetical protein I1H34_09390 [Acaryochloris marina S15]